MGSMGGACRGDAHVIDTSARTPRETASLVAVWIRRRLARRSSGSP